MLLILAITFVLIGILWFLPSKVSYNYAQPLIKPSNVSNPAYTAGQLGWSWKKFAKINPQLVATNDQITKQQYLWQLGRVSALSKQ